MYFDNYLPLIRVDASTKRKENKIKSAEYYYNTIWKNSYYKIAFYRNTGSKLFDSRGLQGGLMKLKRYIILIIFIIILIRFLYWF